MNSLMNCIHFDLAIKMSVSTAHKQSEYFSLNCSWLWLNSLPVNDVGFNYWFFLTDFLSRVSQSCRCYQTRTTLTLTRTLINVRSVISLNICISWLLNINQCLLSHFCPGTFSYRINSRLFPVPLNSKECCPVCKRHKSTHPHTIAEPALIR